MKEQEEQKKEIENIKLKEWEEKFDQEQKLKLQEELIKELKFKEREFAKKEIDSNQDSEVSASTLEDFKIDKTYQN
jgi:hypothetical protein